MATNNKLPLNSAYGIEMEYMIVDTNTLAIKPIADRLLGTIAGEITNEVECGAIALNNELALHVIELKTNGPVDSLKNLDILFHEQIKDINKILQKDNACLLPTGTHPFFVPNDNVALWPHGDQIIYQTFHRIFNCSGHGWTNLQSVHINLPFSNDEEFSKLHNAIRLVLPLIPALAASTPISEGVLSQALDSRLMHYGQNQAALPQIAGDIIPEFITSEREYRERILQPMFNAIAPHDPDKILQEEWLNSRGAIARFERSAIEIRVMDIQECPLMDIACVSTITALIRAIIESDSNYLTAPIESIALKQIYQNTIFNGMQTIISDQTYLDQLGTGLAAPTTMQEVLSRVLKKHSPVDTRYQHAMQIILKQGSLSERLKKAYLKNPSAETITELYMRLSKCLEKNEPFQCQ